MTGALSSIAGSCASLLSQKRTYLGLGAAIAVPLIFVVALSLQKGQPNDVAFGRYVRESGLADPARSAPVRLDLAVPADHRARRRRHHRLRAPQRDAEDDLHTLARPRPDLRRARLLTALTYAPRRAILAMGVDRRRRRQHQVGLPPARHAVRDASLRAPGARARRCQLRRLPACRSSAIACFGLLLSALTRNSAASVVGTLMFALLMQLIGILPGLDGVEAVPADNPVPGMAGFPTSTDRLGADHPSSMAAARSTRCRRSSPPT